MKSNCLLSGAQIFPVLQSEALTFKNITSEQTVKIFPQINQEISGAHIGSVAVWKAEAENEGPRRFHNL